MALGYPHPDYLLSQISSAQFSEWIAYSILEPFGSTREDDRAGVICSTIGNCGFAKKKDNTPFKPEDFFPDVVKLVEKNLGLTDERPEKQDIADIKKILMSMATPKKANNKKDSTVLISDPKKPTRKKRVRRRPDLKDINSNLPQGEAPVTF